MHDFKLVDYQHHFLDYNFLILYLLLSLLFGIFLFLIINIILNDYFSNKRYFILTLLTSIGLGLFIFHLTDINNKHNVKYEAIAKVTNYEKQKIIDDSENNKTITVELNGQKQRFNLQKDFNFEDDNKSNDAKYITKIDQNIKNGDLVKIIVNRDYDFKHKPKFGETKYLDEMQPTWTFEDNYFIEFKKVK